LLKIQSKIKNLKILTQISLRKLIIIILTINIKSRIRNKAANNKN